MKYALALALLVGCASTEEAPAPEPVAKEVDLDALAARRANTGGAALEKEVAATRSLNAKAVYASAEGERGLVEFEESVGGEDAARAAIAASGSRDTFSAPTGSAAPSDLDMASDRTEPWINMDLVSSAIRRRQKALQTCWDTVSLDAPGLGKRVLMTIKVDTQGGGTARLAAGSPARHPELASCLSATLGRVDYPEAKNAAVSFEYPLNF